MPIDAILQRLRAVRQEIIQNRADDVLKISSDLLALIKLRIQRTGEDYTGSPFVPYTPFTVKDRKAKGYQVGYVDFTQTGRLWANVAPFLISADVFGAVVELRGSEQRSTEIIQRAKPKRGNILQPSKDEIELARRANQTRIERYLTKIKVQ